MGGPTGARGYRGAHFFDIELDKIFIFFGLGEYDMAICSQNIEVKDVFGKIFWNKGLGVCPSDQ
jgi:hypothetical protein